MPLDIENFSQLVQYLRDTGRIEPDESPRLTNLAGGVSNRTVLLERPSGEAWVMKQALERLRVKAEWHSDPKRIEREALGMKRLAEVAPRGSITPLVFVDPAEHVLAMDAVPQPHENWKTMLLAGRLDAGHVKQFAELLAAIHAAGFERRSQLRNEFEDRSFFESLRLEPYYEYSAQRMPAIEAFIRGLLEETRATRYTLVHGDYSPKNVLVREGRLILLDHEVIHFGDGAFDLGFALTHFLGKANAMPQRRTEYADAAKFFWRDYRHAIGDAPWAVDLERRVCRHTAACLLARCIGRSPLEYLKPEAAAVQANAASAMMDQTPTDVIDLVDQFCRRIGRNHQ